jgi:hypothetical protein
MFRIAPLQNGIANPCFTSFAKNFDSVSFCPCADLWFPCSKVDFQFLHPIFLAYLLCEEKVNPSRQEGLDVFVVRMISSIVEAEKGNDLDTSGGEEMQETTEGQNVEMEDTQPPTVTQDMQQPVYRKRESRGQL